jgi:ribosomal protein L35AE/L33A
MPIQRYSTTVKIFVTANLWNNKIAGSHGKNGVVKVKFQKAVPGQALGTKVELV